jgi:hypothetical protein
MAGTIGTTGGFIFSALADLAPITMGIAGFLIGALAAFLYGRRHPLKEEDWGPLPEDIARERQKEKRG